MSDKVRVCNVGKVRKEGSDRYGLRWTETTSKTRAKTGKSKRDLETHREKLLKLEVAGAGEPLRFDDLRIDGTSASWTEAIERVANTAIECASQKDIEGQKQCSRLSETLSRLSTAGLNHSKMTELEDKLAEATAYIEERRRQAMIEGAPKSTNSRQGDQGVGRDSSARSPVCQPCDTVQS